MTSVDELLADDIEYRDDVISRGLNECVELLPKQESSYDRMFYMGSIKGFEECRSYAKLSDFERRFCELHRLEHREISKGSLSDTELRRMLGLKDSERVTNDNKVWFYKGVRTQVEYVRDHLLAHMALKEIYFPLSPAWL